MIDDVQIDVPLQTKLTDDEIMHCYNHLFAWKTTNLSGKVYAERHNLNLKKLGNMKKALFSCSSSGGSQDTCANGSLHF